MNLYDILLREYSPSKVKYSNFINAALTKWPVVVNDEISLPATINSMSLDVTQSFLALADSNGSLHIRGIEDQLVGKTRKLESKRFLNSCLINCQWYPLDPGMMCVTGSREILLVDCNSFTICDIYRMESTVRQVYSSDWSPVNTSLISVASSASTVRIIDVRAGSSIQCLIIDSLLGSKEHSATRVKWDPTDEEAIYVGDSCGYIHIFDIRSPRKSLQSTSHNTSIAQPVTELTLTTDSMTLVSIHGLWNNINTWTLKDRSLKHLNVHFDMPCSRRRRTSKIPVSGLIKCQAFINHGYIYTPVPEGNGDIYVNDINTGQLVSEFIPEVFRPISARKVNAVVGLRTPYPVLYSSGKVFFRSWSLHCEHEESKLDADGFAPLKPSSDVHCDNWSDSD